MPSEGQFALDKERHWSGLEKEERTRQEAILEFIITESNYYQRLTILHEVSSLYDWKINAFIQRSFITRVHNILIRQRGERFSRISMSSSCDQVCFCPICMLDKQPIEGSSPPFVTFSATMYHLLRICIRAHPFHHPMSSWITLIVSKSIAWDMRSPMSLCRKSHTRVQSLPAFSR